MAKNFKEVWSTQFKAAAINATAYEIFGDADTDQKCQRYGSANFLLISSMATETFLVELDPNSGRTIGLLYPNGSIKIDPDDGRYFNKVKLTNLSGTNSSADEIIIRIARAEEAV